MELLAQSVLQDIKSINADLRKAVEGLDGVALNWRPAGEDTNSLYVLGTHMIGVQRSMVALAANRTIQRDRAAEFKAAGEDVAALLRALDHAEREIEEWLGSMSAVTFAEPRNRFGQQVPAASCLTYALRHLGEHVGHAGLTRQLLDKERAPRPRA